MPPVNMNVNKRWAVDDGLWVGGGQQFTGFAFNRVRKCRLPGGAPCLLIHIRRPGRALETLSEHNELRIVCGRMEPKVQETVKGAEYKTYYKICLCFIKNLRPSANEKGIKEENRPVYDMRQIHFAQSICIKNSSLIKL